MRRPRAAGSTSRSRSRATSSESLTSKLGDPTAFAARLKLAGKISNNLCAHAFELLAPAVFALIQDGVPLDHPAEVARLGGPQDHVGNARPPLRHQALGGPQRADEIVLLRCRQPCQHGADVAIAAGLEWCERLAAVLGQCEKTLPRIGGRGLLPDQLELLKAAQDPAQVASIEPELARDLGRGRARARLELVKHPRLGQRERAVEPSRMQHPDALGVETVEAAHGGDALLGNWLNALLRDWLNGHGDSMAR